VYGVREHAYNEGMTEREREKERERGRKGGREE